MMDIQKPNTPLSQQEIEDIKSVSNSIFMDQTFSRLPKERKTEAVCRAAVLADGLNLLEVPRNILPDDFILNILQEEGDLIFAVDRQCRTPEMYRTAIESTGEALRFFPEEIITPAIAMTAVKSYGPALEYVPEKIKTPEMCRIALDAPNPAFDRYDVIRLIPFADVCMEYLEKSEKLQTDPFMVFGSVRPGIVTPEMARLAVDLDACCFTLVPERLKTKELCAKAVGQYWFNLSHVPEKMKTSEICNIALNNSLLALPDIPGKMKTPAFYMNLVKNDGNALKFIPERNRTPEVCLQAVISCPQAKEFVPEQVSKPSNVYTFRDRLEKEIFGVGGFSFDQICKVFHGETVKISDKHFGNVPLDDFTLDYDRRKNCIHVKPLGSKPGKKQEGQPINNREKRKGIRI